MYAKRATKVIPTSANGNATEPDPGTQPALRTSRLGWLRAALPHVITFVAAVVVTLGAQLLLPRSLPDFVVPTPAATNPPAPVAPTARPTPPVATTLPLSQGITQQEIADVRAEGDLKQAQIYLLLAIVQMDDAQAALRSNELASVDQSLVAIDNSLNLAYTRYQRAGDSARDAVAQRRMEVGKMHDDLYLYPEGMDQRLDTLRQLTLALITEQRP
jgi:hypothetical protein